MKKIKQPKVFISYAWGTQDYQKKVLSFASSLFNDGIDVLLDKWEMSAGNDLNHFMEKSVNDPSVTNVIILLDENYANKANNKVGGVGTETQIISQQVYSSVEQTKFIPVVFERNSNGGICKPTYLLSRYHYDLSKEETYDQEYQGLVKALYGVETYKKPTLGAKPSWVDEQISVAPKTIIAYDVLKSNKSEIEKRDIFQSYLEDIEKKILEYSSISYRSGLPLDEYLKAYESNRTIRKDYLLLLEKSFSLNNRDELIGDFFERVYNKIEFNFDIGSQLSKVFLHELFIYTIAVILKKKSYKEVGYFLGRTYFSSKPTNQIQGNSYQLFYSSRYHVNLDNAVKTRDNKNYHSGTAAYWIETVDIDFCSKDDFVGADLLCFNYSIYGNEYLDEWFWFPITYVYADEYSNYIMKLGRKLLSREKANQALLMFNYDKIENFISRCRAVENRISNGEFENVRYPASFESAPLISYIIKASEIGTVR